MKRFKLRWEVALLTSLLTWSCADRTYKDRSEWSGTTTTTATQTGTSSSSTVFGGNATYVVFAWNDLGMHCLNPSYDKLVILPPYNNLRVQVVKRGSTPAVVTSGLTVTYSVDNNTYSVGKKRLRRFLGVLAGVVWCSAGAKYWLNRKRTFG